MQPHRVILLTAVFLAAALWGCEEPTRSTTQSYAPGFRSEWNPYALEGTVVDEQNVPVSGAEIHFLFTMRMQILGKGDRPAKAMPTTTISFSLPSSGYVSLKIFRLGTRELVATLVDGEQHSGNHAVSFTTSTLTNGFYIYQMVTENSFSERLLVYWNDGLSALTKTNPLTRTDNDGRFRLPQSIFGLEEELIVTNEKGPDPVGISRVDSIGIVVHKNGRTAVRWMKIDPKRTMHEVFTFK